jgi:hypothetical protein
MMRAGSCLPSTSLHNDARLAAGGLESGGRVRANARQLSAIERGLVSAVPRRWSFGEHPRKVLGGMSPDPSDRRTFIAEQLAMSRL